MKTVDSPSNGARRSRDGVGRRTLILVVVAGVVAFPAAVLHAFCVGKSCASSATVGATTPFCSLPSPLRARIAAGYREGRSPDVLAVAAGAGIRGGGGLRPAPSWVGLEGAGARVPVIFQGEGVAPGFDIHSGVTLDAIAPTIARIVGLRRPHPEVRSGTAIEGVATGQRPRLVLEIVLSRVGSESITRGSWPELNRLLEQGAGTLDGIVPSEPLDPAAALTTLGTGGLPRQHGITGSGVRSDNGKLVRAWAPNAPVSVISTLADDLDELHNQRPRIGLASMSRGDRGAIGGNWYVGNDRDDFVAPTVTATSKLLQTGYGRDSVPDLLVAVLSGPRGRMDARIGALVRAASDASDGSVLTVITATGDAEPPPTATPALSVVRRLESTLAPDVVEGIAVGGFFLDQEVAGREHISEDTVVRALRQMRGTNGRLFADVFPGIAVSFARYC